MNELTSNYFNFATAAKRYAAGRPFFHPIVRDAIRAKRAGLPRPKRGLDVACGTGLSTRILADLADHVTGTDESADMIAEAPVLPNVDYVVSSAENLPFEAETFDIITVALAFHWFDRDRFLQEARRVLRPGGLLVIYNHWFCGEMACNPNFAQWNEKNYLSQYPSPKRDSRPFGPAEAIAAGFQHLGSETFSNYWPFSVHGLAHYLLTQSNVIAAVEIGKASVADAFSWIVNGAQPHFRFDQEVFRFQGAITYLAV